MTTEIMPSITMQLNIYPVEGAARSRVVYDITNGITRGLLRGRTTLTDCATPLDPVGPPRERLSRPRLVAQFHFHNAAE